MQENETGSERCQKCGATEEVVEVILELTKADGIVKRIGTYLCWPCWMRLWEKACAQQEKNNDWR